MDRSIGGPRDPVEVDPSALQNGDQVDLIVLKPATTWLQKVLDHRSYISTMDFKTIHKIIDFTLIRIGMKMDYSDHEGLTFKTVDMNKGQLYELKSVISNIKLRNYNSSSISTKTIPLAVKRQEDEQDIPSMSSINR